jgi:hypothetical protein
MIANRLEGHLPCMHRLPSPLEGLHQIRNQLVDTAAVSRDAQTARMRIISLRLNLIIMMLARKGQPPPGTDTRNPSAGNGGARFSNRIGTKQRSQQDNTPPRPLHVVGGRDAP